MEPTRDIELFVAVKKGDKKALSDLYLKYYDHLLHYGIRLVPDHYIVEECIQEMFIYIYEARARLGIVKNAKAYLFSGIRRRILEKIKIERRKQTRESENSFRTNIQFSANEIKILEESGTNKRLALTQILNNLPWRQREAVYLRYFNGLNTNEIAEIMGVANQTVLNTLYQALKRMRGSINLQEFVK